MNTSRKDQPHTPAPRPSPEEMEQFLRELDARREARYQAWVAAGRPKVELEDEEDHPL